MSNYLKLAEYLYIKGVISEKTYLEILKKESIKWYENLENINNWNCNTIDFSITFIYL